MSILDFVEKAEKRRKKIYRANFLGPICILEIFRNNPSKDVWLYYQSLVMVKVGKTEISGKIMKRKSERHRILAQQKQ